MIAGHYVFGLEKSEAAWTIRHREIQALYQTGNLKLLEVAGGR